MSEGEEDIELIEATPDCAATPTTAIIMSLELVVVNEATAWPFAWATLLPSNATGIIVIVMVEEVVEDEVDEVVEEVVEEVEVEEVEVEEVEEVVEVDVIEVEEVEVEEVEVDVVTDFWKSIIMEFEITFA